MNNSKDALMQMIQNEISSMAGGKNVGSSNGSVKDEEELRTLIREIGKKILAHNRSLEEGQTVELRRAIRTLIGEAKKDIENSPYPSTAINLLEELLKQILPGVEIDYKTLTTDMEQRTSFRANLLNGVSQLLAAEDINLHAPELDDDEPLEEVDIQIQDDDEPSDEEKFIDIADKEPEEAEEEEKFGIEGQEETGRNMAAKTYDNIEKNILDAYGILDDTVDRKTFRDYLITNLKLYFDKWETELDSNSEEPTTDAYEKEKEKISSSVEDIEGATSDIEAPTL